MASEHEDPITPVEVAGTARERGRGHGEALRELIQRGLEIWFDRLPRSGGSPQQLIDEFMAGSDHLRAAEQWTPAVVEEIRGISEGAGVAFETMFAYNLADEQQI